MFFINLENIRLNEDLWILKPVHRQPLAKYRFLIIFSGLVELISHIVGLAMFIVRSEYLLKFHSIIYAKFPNNYLYGRIGYLTKLLYTHI